MTGPGERRSVGGLRLLRRSLRATLLRVLAGLGALTGLTARADRKISAISDGQLFKDVEEVVGCDVAIVPGAYVFPDGTPSDMLADRLTAALELVRAGKVVTVIASGGPQEVAGMQAWLVQRGVHDVIADPAGLRTWATMRGAARRGVTRAVICTQRFHLPRSLYLAHAAGIDAVGLIADARRYRGASYNANREACARLRALFDVHWSRRHATD